jgi:hypothetical protein
MPAVKQGGGDVQTGRGDVHFRFPNSHNDCVCMYTRTVFAVCSWVDGRIDIDV